MREEITLQDLINGAKDVLPKLRNIALDVAKDTLQNVLESAQEVVREYEADKELTELERRQKRLTNQLLADPKIRAINNGENEDTVKFVVEHILLSGKDK